MKRIVYISTLTTPLTDEDVRGIGRIASRNNRKLGITGVLFSVHDYFFQILEGEESTLAALLETIRRDPRHTNLVILNSEFDIKERMFPNWSMRTIRLTGSTGIVLQAISLMLRNLSESHRIIERYTQPTVLKLLEEGINPLLAPVERTEKIIVFADMVGFSYLSDQFPVEEVAEVVNAFLQVCSMRIVNHGGEVAKYVGDCVIAYFEPDHADAAIAACLDVLRAVRKMREVASDCRLIQFLYCGIGVNSGTVIEGNFGSSIKLDYTVLGATVNMAARLEALTREIQKPLAISASVHDKAKEAWPFQRVGDFKLKGQEELCTVYTLDDPAAQDFVSHEQLTQTLQISCSIDAEKGSIKNPG